VLPAESTLCSLEEGKEAMLFGSGMAAATAVFQAALSPGDHVVIPHIMYWALRNWVQNFCQKWGVSVSEVDMTCKVGEIRTRHIRLGCTHFHTPLCINHS
jgi:cystathionine gamma-synthase